MIKSNAYRAVDFADGRLYLELCGALVHVSRQHVGHGLSHVLHHDHAADLLLDGAVVTDQVPKLLPLGGVVNLGGKVRTHIEWGIIYMILYII